MILKTNRTLSKIAVTNTGSEALDDKLGVALRDNAFHRVQVLDLTGAHFKDGGASLVDGLLKTPHALSVLNLEAAINGKAAATLLKGLATNPVIALTMSELCLNHVALDEDGNAALLDFANKTAEDGKLTRLALAHTNTNGAVIISNPIAVRSSSPYVYSDSCFLK